MTFLASPADGTARHTGVTRRNPSIGHGGYLYDNGLTTRGLARDGRRSVRHTAGGDPQRPTPHRRRGYSNIEPPSTLNEAPYTKDAASLLR